MTLYDIGSRDLEQGYLDTNNNVLLLLQYAQLVNIQQPLDLQGDAGLVYQVKMFQSQFKTKAAYVQNQLVPSYINILSLTGNFDCLFGAFATLAEELIKESSEDNKKSASSLSIILSEKAGDISQEVTIAAKNLATVNDSLSRIQGQFDSVLNSVIEELGDFGTETTEPLCTGSA